MRNYVIFFGIQDENFYELSLFLVFPIRLGHQLKSDSNSFLFPREKVGSTLSMWGGGGGSLQNS